MTAANPEATPSIQARLVDYKDAEGNVRFTQQRFYEYNPVNEKWHQLKNVDVREMFAQDVVDNLAAPYADINAKITEANAPAIEPTVLNRPKRTTPLVAEPLNNVVDFKKPTISERHPKLVRGLGKVAAGLLLAGVAAGLIKSNETDTAAASTVNVPEAVATTHTTEATTTTEAPTTTSTTEAPTVSEVVSSPNRGGMTPEMMEMIYAPGSTGEHGARELGFIDIDPNNADVSLENFFSELRHNRSALGFWASCLGSKAPSYAKCVEDGQIVADGERLAMEYTAMETEQYATVAESVIAKFLNAKFAGISIENGHYKTVAVGADGFIPSTNTRYNDPRLNFVFEFNGTEFPVQIRSCVQITENEVPTPPEIVTPPEEETPPTTVPPTTTTTVPSTTTTVPETTTTTEATTTTTEATTTTTDSTIPTTDVTPPKNQTTTTNGESTTTVTVGDTTPEEATSSTVSQPTTESTAPADTATSTTAPEGPVDNPPVNNDFLIPPFTIPLGGGGVAWLTWERKKRENETKKRAK